MPSTRFKAERRLLDKVDDLNITPFLKSQIINRMARPEDFEFFEDQELMLSKAFRKGENNSNILNAFDS